MADRIILDLAGTERPAFHVQGVPVVTEAPIDGSEYVRKDGAWAASQPGGVTSVNGETGAVVLDATDVGADPAGSASTVQGNLNSHTGNTSNPHSTTAAQVGADAAGTAAAAIVTHVGLPDPHTQYTTTAEAAAAAPVQSVNGLTGAVSLTILPEAPIDGKQYARKDAGWSEVVSSGGSSAGIQGRLQLDAVNTTFTVTHAAIDTATEFPVVSLEVPSSSSDLFIVGIHNRAATSFQVTLSGVPTASCYLLWHISTQSDPSTVVSSTLTYNLAGQLETVTTSLGTKTMAYNLDGTLATITGTGIYPSKAFTYTLGKLTSVTVS